MNDFKIMKKVKVRKATTDDIDCELCGLYIKNGYKNIGLGSLMFEYITTIFKEHDKKKMRLWCVKENLPAISFYKKKVEKL